MGRPDRGCDQGEGLAPLACKTDRIDCWVLAELAPRSLVPEIWLPDPRVMPATNQVELQPVLHAQTLRDFHAANGIVSQAWSPLSGVNRYLPADAREFKNPLEHPTIVELASPYAKMPAQVLLRWHLERASP